MHGDPLRNQQRHAAWIFNGSITASSQLIWHAVGHEEYDDNDYHVILQKKSDMHHSGKLFLAQGDTRPGSPLCL